jgi:hypothetical protein
MRRTLKQQIVTRPIVRLVANGPCTVDEIEGNAEELLLLL